jgi:disulfide bond formation protein DsbB
MEESMQSLTAMLAIVAGFAAVALVAARLLARSVPAVGAVGARLVALRAPLTLLVAGVATMGSLYFSEVAHYVPCRLCWFQRVAMYPIAVIALVGLVRRDRGARWYFLPLAAIGLIISSYHYLIEWKPSLDTGSCAMFGPACTDIWFRSFGFVTLAFMALCGFAFIIAVNVVTFPATVRANLKVGPTSHPPQATVEETS